MTIQTTHRATPSPTQSPLLFKKQLLAHTNELRTLYPHILLIIMGDFQHTMIYNALHRMGKFQRPPPANRLTPCLVHPLNLVSVIPSTHPTLVYLTWFSKSGEGQAGIDHILSPLENITPTTICGIDYELSNTLFKTDHHLIYVTFDLHSPNTAPTPPTTTCVQYRRVAQIPLRKTYPKDANDPPPHGLLPKQLVSCPLMYALTPRYTML